MISSTTIAEVRGKCKSLVARVPRDILIVGVLILASSLSFGLGYLAGQSAQEGSGVVIEESPPVVATTSASQQSRRIVASRNGTKYYLSSCSGASRISDANKVYFASIVDAASAGYTPAANCKGL